MDDGYLDEVIDMAQPNQLEERTIRDLARLVKHGHKLCNIRVRKDGQEHVFQGDWLCRLFRERLGR